MNKKSFHEPGQRSPQERLLSENYEVTNSYICTVSTSSYLSELLQSSLMIVTFSDSFRFQISDLDLQKREKRKEASAWLLKVL
jgi:hypothetical protein